MQLASRHLERETAGTILNQQMAPRSCINPSESTTMTDVARAFRGFRFPAGGCKVLTPFSADGAASW